MLNFLLLSSISLSLASSSLSLFGLNSVYNSTSQAIDTSILRFNADGSYSTALVINGTNGNALSGTFVSSGDLLYFSPPLGLQDELGIYQVNISSQSYTRLILTTPENGSSFPGNYALYDIQADPLHPGSLIGLMLPQNPSPTYNWAAVVEISSNSTVTLLYNLTSDELNWNADVAPYGAFDPMARNYFLFVEIDNQEAIVTVPLKTVGNASSLVNVTFPMTPPLEVLGLDWVSSLNSLVFITVNKQQAFGLATMKIYSGPSPSLDILVTFNASFGLSGLNEILVDPTGRYVYSIYGDFDPNYPNTKLIPVVDCVTGTIVDTYQFNNINPSTPDLINNVFGLAFL